MAGNDNKMASVPMRSLFWKMGLPMIISMVLQALYNVVDSIFVANMGSTGALANQALTLAFPVQIMIIAIGVGTGVGLNALLSKSLGEKNQELVNRVAGNGIFLGLVIYAVFLLFGIFGSGWFIRMFAGGNETVAQMGTLYLRICVCLSLGSICFTIYERLLQSTGRTMYSTIAQISGALTNVVLDYIFIYPLKMGVAGAAWATVIGQFVSLFIAMFLHYTRNTEIDGSFRYIRPDGGIIRGIYAIGLSAALMQALLSVMMAGMNAILSGANADPTVLVGSFGIYYKIQQIALFAAFGLSNTMISVLSFNYGMKNRKRSEDCIRYGITDALIVTFVITVLFEVFAGPLSALFGIGAEASTEVMEVCRTAIRIASLGYIFMGFSVAVQGVLQALRYALRPLVISLLRLAVFVFPIAWLFTQRNDVLQTVWWTFPITEVLTAIVAGVLLYKTWQEKIVPMPESAHAVSGSVSAGASDRTQSGAAGAEKLPAGCIIAVSREHGTDGKRIARRLARELGYSFYDKEEVKNFAIENRLIEDADDNELYRTFLSLDAEKDAIIKQADAIRSIEERGSCVIVGRGADYVLENNPNLIRIYLYAPMEYRTAMIMKNYGDSKEMAQRNIRRSDRTRAQYYELITNKPWGAKENYDLCINCAAGEEAVLAVIRNYVESRTTAKA